MNNKRTWFLPSSDVYVVAELSANHNQSYERACKIVRAAKEAGADAIKLQTYTADTMTLDLDSELFRIGGDSPWAGRTLHDLYQEAHTPWEWHEALRDLARDLGLDFFSSPFDCTSVDFLEKLGVPLYKIASFELVDIPLIEYIAKTKKPIIMSTGMGTLQEIDDAVSAICRVWEGKNYGLCLLKCTSAYPSPAHDANLRTLTDLRERFSVPVGLSDHSFSAVLPVVAVSLGACVVEKHLTLSRELAGPDSAFSLEPTEFAQMVANIREAEQTLGRIRYEASTSEQDSLLFRRSLYCVAPIKKGERFTNQNVRSIRPAKGLPPKQLPFVLGKKSSRDLTSGTPLRWEDIA